MFRDASEGVLELRTRGHDDRRIRTYAVYGIIPACVSRRFNAPPFPFLYPEHPFLGFLAPRGDNG
jgi:hypothetical protein